MKSISNMMVSQIKGSWLAQGISKRQWLDRCATRFEEFYKFPRDEAERIAEVALENYEFDLEENPEDVADEEMCNWGD